MNAIDERQIGHVVRQFYERIRADDDLRSVFAVVEDWEEHEARLTEFWSSIVLMSGAYKGNPISMHLIHADLFRPEMFERWLALWKATTNEALAPEVASLLQAKAGRIAARFKMALFPSHHRKEPESSDDLQPYRTSREYTHRNMPPVLLRERRLEATTWASIRILSGEINFYAGTSTAGAPLCAGSAVVVRPEEPHRLELAGPVTLVLEFYDQDPTSLIRPN